MKFLIPWNKRQENNPDLVMEPEKIPFEMNLYYRHYFNPDLVFITKMRIYKYHILFQLLEHEMQIHSTHVQGVDLKYIMFTALTSYFMSKFLKEMHDLDILPFLHPSGYRQVFFVDY